MSEQEQFDGLVQRFFIDRDLMPVPSLHPQMLLADFVLIARIQLYASDIDEFREYCNAESGWQAVETYTGSFVYQMLCSALRAAVHGMTLRSRGSSTVRDVDEAGLRHGWTHIRAISTFMSSVHFQRSIDTLESQRELHRAMCTGDAEKDFPSLSVRSGPGILDLQALAVRAEVMSNILGSDPGTGDRTSLSVYGRSVVISTPLPPPDVTMQFERLAERTDAFKINPLFPGLGGDDHKAGSMQDRLNLALTEWERTSVTGSDRPTIASITGQGDMFSPGIRSRQQFQNDRYAPSSGKKGRIKSFASKSGAVYPKPRGW